MTCFKPGIRPIGRRIFLWGALLRSFPFHVWITYTVMSMLGCVTFLYMSSSYVTTLSCVPSKATTLERTWSLDCKMAPRVLLSYPLSVDHGCLLNKMQVYMCFRTHLNGLSILTGMLLTSNILNFDKSVHRNTWVSIEHPGVWRTLLVCLVQLYACTSPTSSFSVVCRVPIMFSNGYVVESLRKFIAHSMVRCCWGLFSIQ